MTQERIEMSERELKRFAVLQQVINGSRSQGQAALALGLSERQIRRLQRGVEREGARALISRRRGRPSNRRVETTVREGILAQVRARYADFGPTLAAEYLRADGYTVSKETLRRWMIAAGLWQAQRKRRTRLHPPRPRRARLGELVQIDGSPHDWFEGRGPRCTLIAFIDDATSRVLYARFTPVESSQAYLSALQTYVTTHGCPVALYSDRHSIFTKHNPEDTEPTQFQRATEALGIATIQALSPQAKGRVERLFQTLQDRLVKALRLAEISDQDTANAWLPQYLQQHNARFAVAACDDEDAHQPYDGSPETLARICAIHHRRTLSKDLVLSFQRQRYIIQTGGAPRYALRGRRVDVVVHADGRIELVTGGEVLLYKVFDSPQEIPHPVDDKSLNARVDAILTSRRWSEKSRPAADHPWRRYPTVDRPGK